MLKTYKNERTKNEIKKGKEETKTNTTNKNIGLRYSLEKQNKEHVCVTKL